MSMDDFVAKFTNLLRNVPYIHEEKKVHNFLNFLHLSYKERVEFDSPKMMDNNVQKARICYE